MIKPTDIELRELAGLRHSPVSGYLARVYEATKEMLVTQSDPSAVRLLQGRAQTLSEVLVMIDPERFSTNGKRG
jgi:hypothetical protein